MAIPRHRAQLSAAPWPLGGHPAAQPPLWGRRNDRVGRNRGRVRRRRWLERRSYSEYVAQGGADIKATKQRWLRSCIREAGSPTAECPTEIVCSDNCEGGEVVSVPLTWACTGEELEATPSTGIGVTSGTQSPKRNPGCKQAACAYVAIGLAGYDSWFGATCCRD